LRDLHKGKYVKLRYGVDYEVELIREQGVWKIERLQWIGFWAAILCRSRQPAHRTLGITVGHLTPVIRECGVNWCANLSHATRVLILLDICGIVSSPVERKPGLANPDVVIKLFGVDPSQIAIVCISMA